MSAKSSAEKQGAVRRRSPVAISRKTLLYAAPALMFYAFVLLVPTLRGMGLAFTDWDGLSRTMEFVAFDNFIDVLTTPSSRQAVIVTVVIAFFYTVLVNGLGLLLALGVHSKIKSRNFLRVFLFAPAVMTPVVTAYLWKYILAPTGPLNGVFDLLGLSHLKQDWLGQPGWALFSIILVMVWQFAGYSMVIFLAGLQGIPAELLEAASVDGAGSVRKFWSITWPLLAPALTINLMLSIVAGLKIFDQVWVITRGGPGGATHTLSTLLYRDAFQYGEMGTSIAMALILFLLVALISGVQYRSLLARENRT